MMNIIKEWRSLSAPRFQKSLAQHLLYPALLCLFTVVCYLPSFDAPFLFDDFPNIVANPAVHPASSIELTRAFSSAISGTRPLVMFSFAANYLFGYLDVFGYHLVNLLIHLGNALLLYRIFIILPAPLHDASPARQKPQVLQPAFWGAALWAANPVQTQAVTYIVQRMTSMATFFYLIAIYAFLVWRKGRLSVWSTAVIVTVCFFLGLTCKEIIITLPFALLLIDYCFFRPAIQRRTMAAAMALALLLVTGLGFLYLNGRLPAWAERYPLRNFSPLERVMTQWRVVWHYVSLLFLPLPSRLHLTYDPSVSKSIIQPWTTLAGLLAMIAVWFGAWRLREKYPAFAFGILFFFLAQIVESSFINLELAFIHRLYLPSAFLFFGFISLFSYRRLQRLTMPLLILLGLWSFWTINRNVEWGQARDFWQADLNRGAGPTRALNNRAAVLIDAGNYGEAISILRQGLTSAAPEQRRDINYNLGVALYMTNNYDEALRIFQTILEENGTYLNTLLYVGQTLLLQGRSADAEKVMTMLAARPASHYQAAILQANMYTAEGKLRQAEKQLLAALEEEPEAELGRWLKLQLELAAVYLKQGNNRAAYDCYLQIVEKYPQNYMAWRQIHAMLKAGGDGSGAEAVRRFLEIKDVRLEPDSYPAD
jgi:tetratricopeptide (TPR) repeat protein